MNGKEQLLFNIGVVDFTLVDLALFLDTHPTDRRALEYYRHYAQIKKQLCKEFSKKYYPLTMEEANCEKAWEWGAAPMPWEGGCE
ncbi:MAG: spore coat protein CotJB [Lachnospiraceae bacterium]|jgi:spore coat protein JB|nr:spore coat protein CotJB [Lachnospiraceae bacterium]MBQ9488343.1 spore coat protein CotJB [Lachnospiraceae bacterium]MBR3509564.1 spore coat protein CotJB [Lachnospiraceae bacterium]MBR4604886.1 spore coat protein CotJB [Lachnospiraceae bacterium]MBR6150756.1 spore coat protein CotJB [Lachnospiraceae bacterium]